MTNILKLFCLIFVFHQIMSSVKAYPVLTAVSPTASPVAPTGVATPNVEKRDGDGDDDDDVTTIYSYTSTNIQTEYTTIHATHGPTPSSNAASLSSAVSAELASSSSAAATTSVTSSSVNADQSSNTNSDQTSSSNSASATSATSSDSSGYYSYPKNGLKGVNLGGWLVLEPWINTDLFSKDNFPDGNIPEDEFNFVDSLGNDKAGDLLEKHYGSWITEDDFDKIKQYGLNAVRIPIGYWAYKLMSTDKFYKGSQDDYLKKAIGWAKDRGLYVLIDLHGAPGSQNGYDSSGHKNFHDWNKYNNLEETKEILKSMFDKYKSNEYKDTVIGIELVNEPLVNGDNGVSQDYLSDFYSDVIDSVRNDKNLDLPIMLHDGYLYQGAWTGKPYNSKTNIIYDTHLYMLYDAGYSSKPFDEKIKQVCTWGNDIGALDYKEIIGEFTAAWDSDSSSIYTKKISEWGDEDKVKIRKFVEAQFTAFEKGYGWFFWNWKMGDSDQWDFKVLVENDIIPQPLTDRRYSTC